MFESRSEKLKIFKDILDKTNEMIQIAKKRNQLLNESFQKEKEFSEIEKAHLQTLNYIQICKNNIQNPKISNLILPYEESVKKNLKNIKEKYKPFLEKFHEAAELSNEIENYIDFISNFVSAFKNIKLEKEEYSYFKDNLYAVVAIILIINQEDYRINENNFFSDKTDFFNLIKERDEKFLLEILNDKQSFSVKSIYWFLEKI